ncbi:MAG: PLP-dependent cysteine synthase family protein [Flavipsychrobacter sp.]
MIPETSGCNTLIFDDRFTDLWHMVGNTPMIKLCYRYNSKTSFIFIKCEQFNLTGSIKDRIALHILQEAYRLGEIYPGYKIVEATSGNTGISFAALGRALGHKVQIIMPLWLSQERKDIVRSLGAEVTLVSKEDGGFMKSIMMAELLSHQNADIFLPRQFENPLNTEAHEKTTGPEIWLQLQQYGIGPDAFVAGVGTGGTVMGIGKYLRRKNRQIKVYPVEPAESPTLSTGHKNGSHRIQGISDEFIPPIINFAQLDKVLQVHDGDAILMAQKLATQLGLAVGISSGANVIAAIKVKEELGRNACVVSIFPDCNKKYLSTDLVKAEPERDNYLSLYTEFIGYQPLGKIKLS